MSVQFEKLNARKRDLERSMRSMTAFYRLNNRLRSAGNSTAAAVSGVRTPSSSSSSSSRPARAAPPAPPLLFTDRRQPELVELVRYPTGVVARRAVVAPSISTPPPEDLRRSISGTMTSSPRSCSSADMDTEVTFSSSTSSLGDLQRLISTSGSTSMTSSPPLPFVRPKNTENVDSRAISESSVVAPEDLRRTISGPSCLPMSAEAFHGGSDGTGNFQGYTNCGHQVPCDQASIRRQNNAWCPDYQRSAVEEDRRGHGQGQGQSQGQMMTEAHGLKTNMIYAECRRYPAAAHSCKADLSAYSYLTSSAAAFPVSHRSASSPRPHLVDDFVHSRMMVD